jgi:hypothetical protein
MGRVETACTCKFDHHAETLAESTRLVGPGHYEGDEIRSDPFPDAKWSVAGEWL